MDVNDKNNDTIKEFMQNGFKNNMTELSNDDSFDN
jgi:hypothetical protein